MLGYRLFVSAALMIVENIPEALRISGLPAAIMGLAIYLLFGLGWLGFLFTNLGTPGSVLGGLFLLLLYFLLFIWVAVSWHRYALLGIEPKRAWPEWKSDRMWAYAGAFFRILPMGFALGLLAGLIFLIPAAIFNGGSVSTNDGTFLGFLFGVVISFISMRLSLVLPAAAVGEYMRVTDSLRETKDFSKPIFVAALCVGILTAIPNLLLKTPLAPIIGSFAYILVAQWFLLMLSISISIMTALYGYIVEKRELT